MPTTSALYLASKSPRRRELLAQIGVHFEVVDVDVPEQRTPDESPDEYVLRLAKAKAQAGSAIYHDKPVLGADTIVVLGDRVLEKPEELEHGVDMLLALSGRIHVVMTAVCLSYQERSEVVMNQTRVHFRQITRAEAEAYWHTGEPADKAGGYGIQGKGAVFVAAIEGSYSSVVGLPLLETADLLGIFNVPFWR